MDQEAFEEVTDLEEPEEDAQETRAPRARGFFSSLFGRKKHREETEEELSEEELATEDEAEEPAEPETEEPKEVPEEEPILTEEAQEQEVAAQAAAAETIEKLREFVAREEENAADETEEEESEEAAEKELEEKTEEEAGEEAEPEETDEETEEEEKAEEEAAKPMPTLKKPENNPEADAAAAAALERFRQLSAKEEEEDWFADIKIRETQEPARQPVRPRRSNPEEPMRAAREYQEEPVRPLRGNKVYKGNKDPKKAKARTVPDLFDENRYSKPSYQEADTRSGKKKKAKNRKASEQFGAELFAETQENHIERETIDIDELLNAALQNGTSKKKEEITEETLNMLLNSSIDLHKTEEKPAETEKKPEKELTVSETGEYDLEDFIAKDNRKEITRQMSFDDLFGGEFRPKVRIPAEAAIKTPENQLVFS